MIPFCKLGSSWMSVNYLANLRKLNSEPAVARAQKQSDICNRVPQRPKIQWTRYLWESCGLTVMIQTAELFESPLWETIGLPGPSLCGGWTATLLSLWQTRRLLCSWSEIEGVSATPAGRGAIKKTGELNKSPHTKYWDSHHSMAHPTPLSHTVSLNNGCEDYTLQGGCQNTFSGQPRDF